MARGPDLIRPPHPGPVLLEAGLRPFFLLAGFYAVVATAAWLLTFAGVWSVPTSWPVSWWHGHEMVFGFSVAALSGFLLTAVPNWTNSAPLRGRGLALLIATWTVGRVAMWASPLLPPSVVALADLVHLPALAWRIAPPIFRSGRRQNYGVPLVLGALFAGNLLVHLPLLGLASTTAPTGLAMSVYLLVALVTLISGRIVPAFTANALRRRGIDAGIEARPRLERGVMIAVGLAAIVDLATEDGGASGILALVAATLIGVRWAGWQPIRTLGQPILWVLHAGHFWLALGFACKGIADLSGAFPATSAFHAFTAGAIGTMVLAVMSRAALGHTGRPLKVSPVIAVAYGLVIVGAAFRTILPALAPASYSTWVLLAGILWGSGYLLFCAVYLPILTRPRSEAEGSG